MFVLGFFYKSQFHFYFQFGNSGSSVMTHFTEDGESRFAFAGPLSMHKGCDQVGPGFIKAYFILNF